MQVSLISDGEFQTPRLHDIRELLRGYFAARGFTIVEKTIQCDELAFCRGCFDCWVKTPGECVMRDGITEIKQHRTRHHSVQIHNANGFAFCIE